MATPQLSPGVLTREVDLTVGRADNVLDNIGAIAGPFAIGPVEQAIDITTEQELISNFGKPISTDAQYEYWMSASSYLSYGGVLKVVRSDGSTLNNSNAGVGIGSTTSLKIKNYDDYYANYSSATNFTYAAKNPGSWANNLKVCVIDDLADQRIGINTTDVSALGALIGYGVTTNISAILAGAGSTSTFNGYLKGIITGVSTDATNGNSTIDVKIVSRVSAAGTETNITYSQGNSTASFEASDSITFVNNSGINTGSSATATTVVDWYDEQTLGLTNSIIYWKSIAPKPVSNNYSLERNGKNDAMNIAIIDDTGSVTGIQVRSLGEGYTTAPTVTISEPPTGGVRATATAVLTSGRVTSINITNPGSGYITAPTITIQRSPAEPTGKVTRYDGTNRELELINIVGTFVDNDTLVGEDTGAEWTVTSFSTIEKENDPDAENEWFEDEGDKIIDWNETNPFGEYGNMGVF